MTDRHKELFLNRLAQTLGASELIKLTLSKPRAGAENLENLYAVTLHGPTPIKVTFHYTTRDETKNFSTVDFLDLVADQLNNNFFNGNITAVDFQGEYKSNKKGSSIYMEQKQKRDLSLAPTHDRAKHRHLAASAPFLFHLGICDHKGTVKPSAQDKYKQIDKFIEIIAGLLPEEPGPIKIADMGAGKGYLTFGLYYYLSDKGWKVNLTGVERRKDLVEAGNRTAELCGFEGLKFVEGDIGSYNPGPLDLLIALHACDTATDDAIAQGLYCGAKYIVAAPCCHKQVRRDMEAQGSLKNLVRFGILEERQAELITDALRALLLEYRGYKAKVFEFISLEHTAKNLMITAVRSPEGKLRPEKLEEITALKQQFGVKSHYLETLLEKS